MKKILFALSAFALPTVALAQVTVTDVALHPTGPGMGRITATITSPADDELVGASAAPARAMVHTVTRRGTGAVMVPTTVRLHAGVPRRLSVHGDHVMYEGPLPAAPITLTFRHAAPVTVSVTAAVR